jgi:hypothetical protein
MAASVPINSTPGSWTYLVRGSWTRIARCTVRALTRNIKKDPGISFSRTTAFSAALLCRSLIEMSYGSHMNAWFVRPIVIPIAQSWDFSATQELRESNGGRSRVFFKTQRRLPFGWTQWLSFNSNNLVWIALVVGWVLFSSLLMKL